MAARRLVIVMLVLLGISTLAAALVPTPDRDGAESGPTDTVDPGAAGGPQREQPQGRFVRRNLRIDDKPATVRVRPGDQLHLTVGGPFSDDIVVPALGLTATMTPYAPAAFDVLIPRAGTFAIRALDMKLVVARIVSRTGTAACAEVRQRARRGRSRPERCDRRDEPRDRAGGRSDRQPSGAEGHRRR
jgi:hypothetical protein